MKFYFLREIIFIYLPQQNIIDSLFTSFHIDSDSEGDNFYFIALRAIR